MCDKKVLIKLKGNFYRATIRPAMLYGSECWARKKLLEIKLEAAGMRMLCWSYGRIMLDRILNEVFRNALEVAPISVKNREERLRWFDHLRRRQVSAPGAVRRVNLSFALAEFIENVFAKLTLLYYAVSLHGNSISTVKSVGMVCVHLTLIRPCFTSDLLDLVRVWR
ncbi:Rbr2p [Orobanche gracilis]